MYIYIYIHTSIYIYIYNIKYHSLVKPINLLNTGPGAQGGSRRPGDIPTVRLMHDLRKGAICLAQTTFWGKNSRRRWLSTVWT